MEQRKYFRKWISKNGDKIGMSYDTTMANSPGGARMPRPDNMHSPNYEFETIIRVQPEHLKLTGKELSEIYGRQEL